MVIIGQRIQFRTAKPEYAPTKLGISVMHKTMCSLTGRVIRMAYQTAPDASFVIHAGDLTITPIAITNGLNGIQVGLYTVSGCYSRCGESRVYVRCQRRTPQTLLTVETSIYLTCRKETG